MHLTVTVLSVIFSLLVVSKGALQTSSTNEQDRSDMTILKNEIEQLQRLYDELTESWREDEDAAGSLVDANVDRRYVPYKRRLQFQAARGKKSLTTNKRFQYMPSRGKRSTL